MDYEPLCCSGFLCCPPLDVPSNPYSVRLSAVSQRLATVAFMKPDSHGGVPISYYLVQYKEGSQDWRDVKSYSVQSEPGSSGKAFRASWRVPVTYFQH